MEEGPEPQELFDQVEQSHHAAEEEETHKAKSAFTSKCAIVASSLAVLAAICSLLSGHAANEAILKQSEATDQWSYFQAKSTKAHIFEGNRLILEALVKADKAILADSINSTLSKFDEQSKQENKEKERIREDAEKLGHESSLCFERHQNFSYGVACLQIGIVLASISIMVRSRYLYFSSIGCGMIGTVFALVAVTK